MIVINLPRHNFHSVVPRTVLIERVSNSTVPPSASAVLSAGHTLGSRGYFFLIDTSRRSRVNEARSAEEKKITSGHRSTQPHFHARNQFRN